MRRTLHYIDVAVEYAVFIIFLAIVIVGSLQVFNRFALNLSISWSEEFQRYGQIWIVFLGIPIAYRRGVHIGMEMLTERLTPRGRIYLAAVIDLLWIVLGAALLLGTAQLMAFLQFQRSPGMGLRMDWVYGGIVIGTVYMIVTAVSRLVDHIALVRSS